MPFLGINYLGKDIYKIILDNKMLHISFFGMFIIT